MAQEACYWAAPGVAVEDGGVVNVDVSPAGEGTWQARNAVCLYTS